MSDLVLDGLGKDFGSTVALEGLSCRVDKGEIVGLLGPNGAGKTTTMKLILGMLRPTRGSATFQGLDCTRDAHEVKRRLGYSPDEPAFYDFLTGKETIEFVLNVRGYDVDGFRPVVQKIVDQIDFGESMNASAGGYSHGTKKKLALLLALAHDPTLLLLDEPTNGLDPKTASRVRALLRERADAGAAVVVSTHLLEMADLLCDRVLVVNHGRLIAEGKTDAVRAQAGVAADATLEDAFLALVS
ncbi:MAG: ABC transporter ATP-binding protein [Labilithrix sp.]|nr:ABC transporter ATP-binding protein [Labilithrix sp.]